MVLTPCSQLWFPSRARSGSRPQASVETETGAGPGPHQAVLLPRVPVARPPDLCLPACTTGLAPQGPEPLAHRCTYEPEHPAGASSPPHGQLTQCPQAERGRDNVAGGARRGWTPSLLSMGLRAVCWGLPFFGSHASLVPHFLLMTVYVSRLKGQQLLPGADRLLWSLSHTSVTFSDLAFARLLDLNAVI